ncbi:MAG: phosphate signaling complex protein PhoU [Terrimicrobiaceae bacterium]
MSPLHISRNFDDLLGELRRDAIMMGSLTERSLDRVGKGFFERDEDWCNTVIADDEEIDSLEVQIDHSGLALMLRYHPMASDLRNVVATMKLGVNLERIADQTVNIARRSRKMISRAPVKEAAALAPIFDASREMVRDAVKAYADDDLALALSLKPRDKDLDILNLDYAERLTQLMATDVENIPTYMDLIFIARFLERIGDLAKTIGEDTVFAISAEDTRHIG